MYILNMSFDNNRYNALCGLQPIDYSNLIEPNLQTNQTITKTEIHTSLNQQTKQTIISK